MKHLWVAVLLLCGCAAERPVGLSEGPQREYTGVVERVQPTMRGSGVSRDSVGPAAAAFGLIGGAVAAAAAADQPALMHDLKLATGASVTVVADDAGLKTGDCVRLIVNDPVPEPLPYYAHGQAKLTRVAC